MRTIILIIICLFSSVLKATEITDISINELPNKLDISWIAFGQKWQASINKDIYFGDEIPIINLSVNSGNETLNRTVKNRFYRGALLDPNGQPVPDSTIFIDRTDVSIPFTGFVAVGPSMYLIERDDTVVSGVKMRLESTGNSTGTDEVDSDNNGWGQGGSGGALKPDSLYSRGRKEGQFPTLDIYVNPNYIQTVAGNYLSRVFASLAVANTMYAQSELNQIHLLAIILPDDNLGRTDSQGNIIHSIEKIRKYTVTSQSADGSIVYSGNDFSMPSLWGWAELGFGCDLQIAVNLGDNINTHKIGKASAALIDLPTLIQRGWILGHEFAHILGGVHIFGDPIFYGFFQPQLALKDYVSGCVAKSYMYKSCRFDEKFARPNDFYQCP